MIRLYDLILKMLVYMTKLLPRDHAYRQWLRYRDQSHSDTVAEGSILFACASLGEYEAIKELSLQLKNKGATIHLMFFSPSGYKYAEQHAVYDLISYSPVDSIRCVKQYLNRYSTHALIISGNNFWPTFMHEINRRQIPFFCLDLKIYNSRSLYNRWLFTQLRKAKLTATYDPSTHKLLSKKGINNQRTAPMRLSSLYKEKEKELPIGLSLFVQKADTLIIYGSTHSEDINLLTQIQLPNRNSLIIAPHHTDKATISELLLNYPSAVRLSSCTHTVESNILIIDSIGLLKHLYRYADMAYIGGGLKQGIHSVLEPAIHEIPIAFGPVHSKFPEAQVLIDSSQATVVTNTRALQEWIKKNKSHSFDTPYKKESSSIELDSIVNLIWNKLTPT